MVIKSLFAVLGIFLFLSQGSLEKIAQIELPGPQGQRFDYLAIDGEDQPEGVL